MDEVVAKSDALLRLAAKRLRGAEHRRFIAQVTADLCGGNRRWAERRFGWGRETIRQGQHELRSGVRCVENFAARGRPRWEVAVPQRAVDIQALVEPYTQADPELKSARRYTNLSAAEVLAALRDQKQYRPEDLPSERTMRDILNRMNYRLKRIQKSKPLKKTKDTDAIFANLQAVHEQAQADPATLEISVDTKAKVSLGEYSRGGKKPDRFRRTDASSQRSRPTRAAQTGAVRHPAAGHGGLVTDFRHARNQ